ncbi:uncharacterized protein LOC132750958 [Ruditapes philippinarum]|uniref:uncharacterized protein LOC132750958 n=1 Tax=Ruditapes philippinarum TaxID=129788 RepID=UPI00295B4B3E|nr:uncharacterized protein LOC132750958 [Ruditapes philippinarum]
MTKLSLRIFFPVCLFSLLTLILFKNPAWKLVKFTEDKKHDVDYEDLINKNANNAKSNALSKVTDRKSFDLRIIVLVYDRAKSLQRLLNSLNEAEYASDIIKLEIWIDRSEYGNVDNITLQAAINFNYLHGDFEVIVHQHHVGIVGQWLTTWKPNINSNEIVVFLEDDVTVSKYFWKYLKMVHRKFDNRSDINGFSLQGYSRTFSLKHKVTTLRGPKDYTVFLFPVLGSWGFSPSTKNWKQFLDWFYSEDKSSFNPYAPGNIASNWYKTFSSQGKANTMWTMWHIYYAWKNNEYTLHCNFPENAGLTTNWREKGLHYSHTEGSSNKLLTEWKSEYDNLPDHVPYLNLSGHVIHY